MIKILNLSILFVIMLATNHCGVSGEYTLFDINGTLQKSKPINLIENSDSTYNQNSTEGYGRITLKGNAGATARWLIPINRMISSECKVYFEISSTNIRTTQNKWNLNLVLKTPQAHSRHHSESAEKGIFKKALTRKKISIFKAAGSRDSAISWLSFNELKEHVFIEGFFFDLELIDCCEGNVTLSDLRIVSEGNLLPFGEVEDILSEPPPVKAKVVRNGTGALALSVNGVEQSGLGYSSGFYPQHSHYGSLISECHINLTRTLINFGGESSFFTQHKPVWIHPEYIDFHRIDRLLKKACLNKNTYVIIEILFHTPPDWWIKRQISTEKPHESWSQTNGSTTSDGTKIRKKWDEKTFMVSDFDPSWKKYCEDALKQLFAYIRNRPYAPNIIGCHIISGIGMNDFPYPNRDRHLDYIRSFQDWLLGKYKDIDTLRKLWKNESIEFSKIVPAPSGHWNKGDIFSFIHPARGQHAFDNQIFYQKSWSETLLFYCQLIKSLTHKHYLTGVIDGPGLIFNSLWNNSYQPMADAVDPILQSNDVDYLEVPVDTMDLRNGSGANGMEGILGDELQKHNKILFLRNQVPFSSSTQSFSKILGNSQDLFQIQRRIFVASLTNNAQLFLFQTAAQEYEDDAVKKEIKDFQTISRKALSLSKSKHAELAFVIDFDTFKYLAPDGTQTVITAEHLGASISKSSEIPYLSSHASSYFHLLGTPRLLWNRMGGPYDVISLESFEPGSYRTIVLFHTLFLNKEREEIINSCKNDQRYLVSTWANGFVSDRYLSPLGMEKLTDFSIRMSPKRIRFHSKVQPALEKFLSADIKSTSIGWLYVHREPSRSRDKEFGPIFQIDDEQATILAKYLDAGTPSMAIKQFEDWTSVYSASPIIYPEIMREILRRSGAHIYLDTNDLVYINDSFIGIHTLTSGIKKLHLPKASPLYEVFRKHELKKNKIHSIKLQGKKTYLFYRGEKEIWDSL